MKVLATDYQAFIYSWLFWVFIALWAFSLAVASRSYSLLAVHRLLIMVAPLVREQGPQGEWTSVAVAPGL